MNVELNLGELELIVEALNQKHDALSSGGAEVLAQPAQHSVLCPQCRDLALADVFDEYEQAMRTFPVR